MRLTVKDLQDGKGTRRFCHVQVTSLEQAVAASQAGMDLIGTGWVEGRKQIAQAVPDTHFQYGLQYGQHVSASEALRAAFDAQAAGAESLYCPMSP